MRTSMIIVWMVAVASLMACSGQGNDSEMGLTSPNELMGALEDAYLNTDPQAARALFLLGGGLSEKRLMNHLNRVIVQPFAGAEYENDYEQIIELFHSSLQGKIGESRQKIEAALKDLLPPGVKPVGFIRVHYGEGDGDWNKRFHDNLYIVAQTQAGGFVLVDYL